MKTIVEFGIPKSALPATRPCGIDGSFVMPSAGTAARAASQLIFVLGKGQKSVPIESLTPKKNQPRVTYWPSDRSFWISVSLLDGTPRGSYGAKADKDALNDTSTNNQEI